tara:strand:- start:959 stop:1738 length:780 start_codon:yes stop_codon:yes gene_type:complete
MGYFSFTCAKTGLPVVSGDSGCDPKFYKVVLLERDGGVIKGDYDGYGGIGRHSEAAHNVGSRGGDKLVLAHFYAGEAYEQLGDSAHDPNQGAFDPAFTQDIYRAQENIPGFDGRQYIRRSAELQRLHSQMVAAMELRQGFTASGIYELDHVIDRADCYPPSEAEANIRAAWKKALLVFPGGMLPDGHAVSGMEPREALALLNGERERVYALLSAEVVSAWSEGRATRVPNFAALADGADGAWGQPGAGASAAAARRARP